MLLENEKGNEIEGQGEEERTALGDRMGSCWHKVLDEMNGSQCVGPRNLSKSCFNTYTGAICYIPRTLESQIGWPRG